MGIMGGNPTKEPMHYGEVFGSWSYLFTTKGFTASFQTLVNHTGDKELREILKECIKLGQEESKELETLLKENGVGLPPTPPDRPEANLEDIPVGARYLDAEIAAMLSGSVSAGLVSCSVVMGQCIREDIGAMFGQFHMKKAALGLKILRMNKEKGWLIPPPLHVCEKES